MRIIKAKFSVGQVIKHRLFNYRGVIIDVDPDYQGTEEWYNQVAMTRPPKNEPWYHVLVHNAVHQTYVAERNIETDDSNEYIHHPLVNEYFEVFENGRYLTSRSSN